MTAWRILIADDEAHSSALLADALSLLGYLPAIADSGAAAIDAVRNDPPHLLLLDIEMPGMDGFDVIDILRREGFAIMPIIVLSHFDRANLKIRALELGADDYLVKPFNHAELAARIKAALRRSQPLATAEHDTSGDLRDISLQLLLQSLELGRKTAIVTLQDPRAEISLCAGRFVSATLREFTDREALLRLMLCAEGKFAVRFRPDCPPPNGAPQISAVLLDLAPRLDEVRSRLSSGLVDGNGNNTRVDALLAAALRAIALDARPLLDEAPPRF